MRKIKIILSILCIILIPLLAFFVTINLIVFTENMIDRYSEGNKKRQEEYLSSFAKDDVIELDALYGDKIFWYNDAKQQYSEFKIFDSEFGEYYSLEYNDGNLREYPSNEYAEVKHNYKTSYDFHRDMFAIELNISDYEMNIRYSDKLTEKQNSMIVTCVLKGENQLYLNFKYRKEEIVINDVIIEYCYYLNEDSYMYKRNDTLEVAIKFTYNGVDYTLYGIKYS